MTTATNKRELNMAKKIHKFGHGSARDKESLIKSTGYDASRIKRACEKYYDEFGICAATGPPVDEYKISITHINSAINEDIQADFLYVKIRLKEINPQHIGSQLKIW